MVQLLDGPLAGSLLTLRRAPIYLRCTIDRTGRVDALDQLDDEPRPEEIIHVYRRRAGTWGSYHVRPGGCFQSGDYEHVPDAPTDEIRDTAEWRAWVERVAAGEPEQD